VAPEATAVNIVERFAKAFNGRDVDALLTCFTADATYRDLFYGPHAGQAALRGMFERMFHEGRDYHWSMDAIVLDEGRAAAERTFGYTASAAVPRSEGRRVRFSGMSIFELEDGRIHGYREYANTGAALLQLGFAPESIAKVLRRGLETG